MDVYVSYLDISTSKFESLHVVGVLKRPERVDVRIVNLDVDKQRNRTNTVIVLENAKNLADDHRFGDARDLLLTQIEKIQTSESGSDPFCKLLIEDLKFLELSFSDKNSYQSSGNKIANDLMLSISTQRGTISGNLGSSKSFNTFDQDEMRTKSQSFRTDQKIDELVLKEMPRGPFGLVKKNSFQKFFKTTVKTIVDTSTVPKWLLSINLAEYVDKFMDKGYDDLELLHILDDVDFDMIGIDLLGHRAKIMTKARWLVVHVITIPYTNVESWLESINMQQYNDIFLDNGFTELEIVKCMTRDHLIKMGLQKPGHIRKILFKAQSIQ